MIMPRNRTSRTITALFLCALLGCLGGWEDFEYIVDVDASSNNTPVWADDDSEIAFLVGRGQSRGAGLGSDVSSTRNERWQLYVEMPDATGRRSITPEGQWSPPLYHMKRSGYFVMSERLDAVTTRVVRVSIDGAVSEIGRKADGACDPFAAVPSPSGQTIAVVSCAPNAPGFPRVIVRFLEASTLSELRRDTLGTQNADCSNVSCIMYTWRSAGDFVVALGSVPAGRVVRSFAPDRSSTPADLPRCFSPKTRSGAVSSTGRKLVVQGMKVIATGITFPAEAFGCQ